MSSIVGLPGFNKEFLSHTRKNPKSTDHQKTVANALLESIDRIDKGKQKSSIQDEKISALVSTYELLKASVESNKTDISKTLSYLKNLNKDLNSKNTELASRLEKIRENSEENPVDKNQYQANQEKLNNIQNLINDELTTIRSQIDEKVNNNRSINALESSCLGKALNVDNEINELKTNHDLLLGEFLISQMRLLELNAKSQEIQTWNHVILPLKALSKELSAFATKVNELKKLLLKNTPSEIQEKFVNLEKKFVNLENGSKELFNRVKTIDPATQKALSEINDQIKENEPQKLFSENFAMNIYNKKMASELPSQIQEKLKSLQKQRFDLQKIVETVWNEIYNVVRDSSETEGYKKLPYELTHLKYAIEQNNCVTKFDPIFYYFTLGSLREDQIIRSPFYKNETVEAAAK